MFLVVMATSTASLDTLFQSINSRGIYTAILVGILFSLVSWFALFTKASDQITKMLATAQLLADALLASYITYVTGGLQSAFILIYGLNILTGSILLFTTGAIVAALLSVFSFAGVAFVGLGSNLFHDGHSVVRLVFVCCSLILVGGMVALLFKNRQELISSLRRTRQDLKGLTELQIAIVDHIPSGVLLVSPNKYVLYCNELARSILGVPVLGQSLVNLKVEQFLFQGLAELSYQNKSGQNLTLRYQTIALDENQSLIVFEDITNVRALEDQVRLKQRLASIGHLAAGLAHEIKNPLASLSGSIQLLKKKEELSESELKLMSIVLRETDRLDSLLQNFLDYAKPSRLDLKNIAVRSLIEPIVGLCKNDLTQSEKQIEFDMDIPQDLHCVLDAQKMKQIFWNLIRNAVSSIERAGKVKISAYLKVNQNEEILRFEVQDSGKGMDEETQTRAFEPFFTNKSDGTGLGLALVYQIIQVHEGTIGIESGLGEGSLFWIELRKAGPKVKTVTMDGVAA